MAGLIVWSFEGRLFSSLTHLLKKDFVTFRPFFHLHHFKKGHRGRPGVMGGDRGRLGETGGDRRRPGETGGDQGHRMGTAQ